MPITDILARNAALYGEDVSLVELDPDAGVRRELTWTDFDRFANRIANALLSSGIKRGDKVAILMMNCLEWLPVYFGVLKTGALAVPLNFRYTAGEIRDCLAIAEADMLMFGPEFIERVTSELENIKVKKYIYVDGNGAKAPDFAVALENFTKGSSDIAPDIKLTDEDDAALYFTSGTTGFPKAILHPHRSLTTSCETEMAHHHQTRGDCYLCIPPLYHTGAKMHWFGSLLSGSRAVLLKGVKPRTILKAISDEQCTIVWLLVPWAQDILDAIDSGEVDLAEYKLDQWRLMHIGAQPVPPSLIKRWKKRFPNHEYDTNYGLSESTGPGCVHLGVENIDKVGAIGIPDYNWQAKIVDDSKNEVPDGEVGELAVKGPGVMRCYYNDPKATAAVLRDGWLFTGDMAKREDGFIYLVDRKKDVIISGGENIFPVQIEDHLRANEHIKDVAVIGLPEHRLGEIVAAIIEVKPGHTLTEADVNAFCSSLPRYKRPRKVIFDTVPRNPTGKIEKPKLRERYCSQTIVEAQIL